MPFRFTHITRASFFFLGLLFMFSSCLKKIEEVDDLNTNIFDREYAGEQWFVITDYYQYINNLGQNRVRVTFEIPDENLPDLKASYFSLAMRQSEGNFWSYYEVPLNGNGGYGYFTDFAKNEENTYCLSVGVHLPDEEVVINDFQECISL